MIEKIRISASGNDVQCWEPACYKWPDFAQEILERGEKVSVQIAGISERHDRLQEQVAEMHQQVEVLEAALREKMSQSRREGDDIRTELHSLRGDIEERIGHSHREAEDIRTQLAPLLEAHGQRGADDERLSQEFDRLRESLAESLGDLSERLRRAVRGAG